MLEDLARQVGVAVRAARLTTDLQRSREQLVTAREEERRRLRRDLHDGPALDALGLMEVLRSQVAHQDHNGLRISIYGPEELPALPAAVEVAAYRIALEALTNVMRHAEARNCTVRLEMHEKLSALRLEVEDDGRGIEENRRAGVGLSSMRERAEELGGSCTVEAIPCGGTRVRAFLPWRQPTSLSAGSQEKREKT